MHKNNLKALADFKKTYPEYFKNVRVLELGAWGSDKFREFFENCSYLGIDMQPGNNVNLVVDALKTQFAANSFDVLICFSLFEHSPHWKEIMEHNLQWLRQDGLILLCWGAEGNKRHEYGPFRWAMVPAWEVLDFIKTKSVILDHFFEDDRYGCNCPGAYDIVAKKLNDQKLLWENLAKTNSKYYINSDFGKGITEKEFAQSGVSDYQQYIATDPLIKAGDTILEIGCGIGRLLEGVLQDALFKNIIGIDISGEMIRQAKDRLEGFPNLKLIETNGYILPLAEDSIDFAFSYLVFQHFKTREMIESNFREVFRVLKPQGLFKVRVRTDKADLRKWWGGVDCDEKAAIEAGFKLIKKEPVKSYGLWLWLEKGSATA